MTDKPKRKQNKVRQHSSGVEVVEFNKELVKEHLPKPPRKKRTAKKKEPEVQYTFPDKKGGGLKGQINTGTIFIGDTGFFADNPQNYAEGIIKDDHTNPFKDWDKFNASHPNDCNLDLPGSYNGDLPGRGVVIQTNMLSGSYSIEREECPSSGKLLAIRVVFRD